MSTAGQDFAIPSVLWWGVLGGIVGGALSVAVPKLFGGSEGWSLQLGRAFSWIKLGYVRAAGGAVFGVSISAALSLSISNEPHHKVTYLVWYGVAFLSLAVAIVATVLIDRRTVSSTTEGTLPIAPGDLARQDTSLGSQGRRTYGGGEFGAALRRHYAEKEANDVFVAVEGETALAHEEALEMIKLLRAEWPHITPDGALVESSLPDWREKTTAFIADVFGSAQRSAFKASATGANSLERLESEARFLSNLALGLTPAAIRVGEDEFLAARRARRQHGAAGFLTYDHHRASGAPPFGDTRQEIDALMREGMDLVAELSPSVQPERLPGGGLKVSGGDAPDEWWEKASAFFTRSTDLLKAHQPALLKDFEDGFNRRVHQSDGKAPDHANDKRSTVQKMLDFADAERSTPREIVEASLDGLTEARRRLGERAPGTPPRVDAPAGPAHDLADFYKEGDKLRGECRPPDDASTVQLLMWNLGGNPRQVELEKKAQEWDAAVSDYLWARSELKIHGPIWKEAGDPPGPAAILNQARTTPATLGEWYEAKLQALTRIIEKVR